MNFGTIVKYSIICFSLFASTSALSIDWYFYKNGIKAVDGNVYANGIYVKDKSKVFEIDGHNIKCGLTEEKGSNFGGRLIFQRKLFCLLPSDNNIPTAVSIFIECTRDDFFIVQQLHIEINAQEAIIPSVVCTNDE